jgi:hypothetical protein
MHPYFANSTINLCSFESINKHTHLIFAFAKLVWFYRKTIFNNLCNKITERESQNATAIFRFHSRKLAAQKNIDGLPPSLTGKIFKFTMISRKRLCLVAPLGIKQNSVHFREFITHLW